jgi:hypothetical protein
VVAVGDDEVAVDVVDVERAAAEARRGEGAVGGLVGAAGVLAARLAREHQPRLKERAGRADQLEVQLLAADRRLVASAPCVGPLVDDLPRRRGGG